ncbi:Sterile alpha and TIR motif-containing protein 1 [Balamuthia mandrillaris]
MEQDTETSSAANSPSGEPATTQPSATEGAAAATGSSKGVSRVSPRGGQASSAFSQLRNMAEKGPEASISAEDRKLKRQDSMERVKEAMKDRKAALMGGSFVIPTLGPPPSSVRLGGARGPPPHLLPHSASGVLVRSPRRATEIGPRAHLEKGATTDDLHLHSSRGSSINSEPKKEGSAFLPGSSPDEKKGRRKTMLTRGIGQRMNDVSSLLPPSEQIVLAKGKLIQCLIVGDKHTDEYKQKLIEQTTKYMQVHYPSFSSGENGSDAEGSTLLQTYMMYENKRAYIKITRLAADEESTALQPSSVDVVIVLFSISHKESCEAARGVWIRKAASEAKAPIILVGLMTDPTVTERYPESYEQGLMMARNTGCDSYFELTNLTDMAAVQAIFDEAITSFVKPLKIIDVIRKLGKLNLTKRKELGKPPKTELRLNKLGITDTKLVVFMDESLLQSFQHLVSIDLSNNSLRRIPQCIFALDKLEHLRLDDNYLRKISPQIGQMQSLKVLELENNNLHSLPLALGNMKNLTELNFKGNSLRDPPKEVLASGLESIQSYLAQRHKEKLQREENKARISLTQSQYLRGEADLDAETPKRWKPEAVMLWLEKLSLSRYRQPFLSNHVDGEVLLSLTEQELMRYLGVAEEDCPKLTRQITLLNMEVA